MLNMKKNTQSNQKMDQDMKKIFYQRINTDSKYSKKLKSFIREMHIKTMMEILYIYLNYENKK